MTVGERIKQRRTELKMSQQELADKIGYTSRSTINKIEKDANQLRQPKIMEFAKALSVTPAYLLGWEDEEILIEIENNSNKDLAARISKLSDRNKNLMLAMLKSMEEEDTNEDRKDRK